MVGEIIRFNQRYKLRSQFGYGKGQGLSQKLSSSRTEKSSIEDRYTIFNKWVQSESSSDLFQMTTDLFIIYLSDALSIDSEYQLRKVSFYHSNFSLLEYLVVLVQWRFFRCLVFSESSHDKTSGANLEGFLQKVEIIEVIKTFGLVLKFEQLRYFVNVSIWKLEFVSFLSLFYEFK